MHVWPTRRTILHHISVRYVVVRWCYYCLEFVLSPAWRFDSRLSRFAATFLVPTLLYLELCTLCDGYYLFLGVYRKKRVSLQICSKLGILWRDHQVRALDLGSCSLSPLSFSALKGYSEVVRCNLPDRQQQRDVGVMPKMCGKMSINPSQKN